MIDDKELETILDKYGQENTTESILIYKLCVNCQALKKENKALEVSIEELNNGLIQFKHRLDELKGKVVDE